MRLISSKGIDRGESGDDEGLWKTNFTFNWCIIIYLFFFGGGGGWGHYRLIWGKTAIFVIRRTLSLEKLI